ncbi:MAG: hypothetical protein ACRED4_05890, partial [Brevundimonas sp.]
MFASGCRLVLALFLLGLATAHAVPRTDFAQALREADAIRTSDTARFSALVLELKAADEGASPADRHYLQLLEGYRLLAGGDLSKSVSVLNNLLRAEDLDVALRVRASALLVNTYALSRDFTAGLKQIDYTATLLDKVKDKAIRHQALLAAAILYNQVGQVGLGLRNAEAVRQDDPGGRFLCMAAQLETEASQGLEKALPDEDYNEAINLCQSIGEPIMANLTRSYLAKKWFSEGKPNVAIALLEEHLGEVEATGYPYLIGEFNSLIARFRLAGGDVAQAERHAHAAIEQGIGFPSTGPLVTAYRVLYSIAEMQDKPYDALMYYKRYAEADKIYLDEVKTREMA